MKLRTIMIRAFEEVYSLSQKEQVDMRTAAFMLGVGRVAEAIKIRGIFP